MHEILRLRLRMTKEAFRLWWCENTGSLRGAQRRGNPFPRNAQHCTGRQAGHMSGPTCAPAGARKPCGLRGNGLPRPLRGLAMTDLGVRCVSIEHAKAPGSVRRGRDPRPTVRATTVRKLLRLRLSHDSGGPLRPLPFSPGPCPCFPGGTSGRCGAGRAWWPC